MFFLFLITIKTNNTIANAKTDKRYPMESTATSDILPARPGTKDWMNSDKAAIDIPAAADIARDNHHFFLY